METTDKGIEVRYNDKLSLVELEKNTRGRNLYYFFLTTTPVVVFWAKNYDTSLERIEKEVKEVIELTEGLYD